MPLSPGQTIGYTADQVVAFCAVVGLVGGAIVGIVGWFLHARDMAQAREMEIQAKDLARMDASVKAMWLKVDELRESRQSYWTRDDQDRWRAEIKADNAALRAEIKGDMAELGGRLVGELEKLSRRFAEVLAVRGLPRDGRDAGN